MRLFNGEAVVRLAGGDVDASATAMDEVFDRRKKLLRFPPSQQLLGPVILCPVIERIKRGLHVGGGRVRGLIMGVEVNYKADVGWSEDKMCLRIVHEVVVAARLRVADLKMWMSILSCACCSDPQALVSQTRFQEKRRGATVTSGR